MIALVSISDWLENLTPVQKHNTEYVVLFYLSLLMWGNNHDSPLSDFVKLQNKVVQIINDVPIRDHITPL